MGGEKSTHPRVLSQQALSPLKAQVLHSVVLVCVAWYYHNASKHQIFSRLEPSYIHGMFSILLLQLHAPPTLSSQSLSVGALEHPDDEFSTDRSQANHYTALRLSASLGCCAPLSATTAPYPSTDEVYCGLGQSQQPSPCHDPPRCPIRTFSPPCWFAKSDYLLTGLLLHPPIMTGFERICLLVFEQLKGKKMDLVTSPYITCFFPPWIIVLSPAHFTTGKAYDGRLTVVLSVLLGAVLFLASPVGRLTYHCTPLCSNRLQ